LIAVETWLRVAGDRGTEETAVLVIEITVRQCIPGTVNGLAQKLSSVTKPNSTTSWVWLSERDQRSWRFSELTRLWLYSWPNPVSINQGVNRFGHNTSQQRGTGEEHEPMPARH